MPTPIDASIFGEPDAVARLPYCYLTTTGRRSGRPHTVEIWFGMRDSVMYVMSGAGERSDWVRNLRPKPSVLVRVGEVTVEATARVVGDPEENAMVRRLLAAKYQGWVEGEPLSTWARTALPIALEVGVA